MPIVSVFFGIIVRLFHDDHPPPHMHVEYGEYAAVIEIATGNGYELCPDALRALTVAQRRRRAA